jgi:glutathione S-transferase
MSVTKIRLYHCPATRSARVKWLLGELLGPEGFEEERISLYDGEQYLSEFRWRNPNHAVPVLKIADDAGHCSYMIESGAMMVWLADAFPDKALAPPPGSLSFERADYLQMLHFGSTTLDMMLWQIRCHEHLLPELERDMRVSRRYRQKFATEGEPQLVGRLLTSGYICGEKFSAADCVVGQIVIWARAYRLCQHPVFRDYLDRLSQRPPFRMAYADTAGMTAEVPANKRASIGMFSG